jgi:hypothetical protein
MRWTLIRPGVIRLVYENGAFFAEYRIGDRRLLGVNRGGTVEFDLAQVEEEAKSLMAQGVTTAVVTK